MRSNLTYGDYFWFVFVHMLLNALAACTLIGIYFSMPYSLKKFCEKFLVSLEAK